jgi:hypothetical protein
MTFTSRNIAVLVFAAAGLHPAGAQAQWYSSVSNQPPLYPYAAPSNQPYAVQVAPNTYVIRRPEDARPQPQRRIKNTVASAPARSVTRSKVDPALVEELRKRPKVSRPVINTTQVVRSEPVVIETKRFVDDPPRVVERYVDGNGKPIEKPAGEKQSRGKTGRVSTAVVDAPVVDTPKGKNDVKRVISAEAEITILGPDRMNIRLFRKGHKASASAEENFKS